MLSIKTLIKHDLYQKALCERLESKYDVIYTNVPLYSKRHRLVGEIDILAFKDGTYDVFEVKCSKRIVKARKQLEKFKRHLQIKMKLDVGKSFFFCGASSELIMI